MARSGGDGGIDAGDTSNRAAMGKQTMEKHLAVMVAAWLLGAKPTTVAVAKATCPAWHEAEVPVLARFPVPDPSASIAGAAFDLPHVSSVGVTSRIRPSPSLVPPPASSTTPSSLAGISSTPPSSCIDAPRPRRLCPWLLVPAGASFVPVSGLPLPAPSISLASLARASRLQDLRRLQQTYHECKAAQELEPEETLRAAKKFIWKSQAWSSTVPYPDVDDKNNVGGDADDGFTGSRRETQFRGVHRAIICGKVGQVPVQKILRNGHTVTVFTVGTAGLYDQRAVSAKNLPIPAQWHRIAVHNEKLGAYAVQKLVKNAAVYVEGDIETRLYNDKINDQLKNIPEICVRQDGKVCLIQSSSCDVSQSLDELREGLF